MSSDNTNYFTKENLDQYLRELGKEYKRRNRKSPEVEIILIGGAAILANYDFRNMTTDVDAVIQAESSMKEAINIVGDKFGLPNGWLNSDFMRTASYSPKLSEFSVFYHQYAGILNVRTVKAEYLIAMKLRAGRKYKKDLSDVVGVLYEHEKNGSPVSMQSIEKAVTDLYGGWEQIPEEARQFLNSTFASGKLSELYDSIRAEEERSKSLLVQFEGDYPGIANTDNVESILKNLKSRDSIIRHLKEKQQNG